MAMKAGDLLAKAVSGSVGSARDDDALDLCQSLGSIVNTDLKNTCRLIETFTTCIGNVGVLAMAVTWKKYVLT